MSLHRLRQALALSPGVVLAKGARLLGRRLKHGLISRSLRRHCTYPSVLQAGGTLVPRLPPIPAALLADQSATIHELARRSRLHGVDLLGSGWIQVNRGLTARGFGGHRHGRPETLPSDWRAALAAEVWPGNQPHAAHLLSMIDDDSYRPLDWHMDIRSGYRWSVRTWGASIAYAHLPGVDVKLPWELARLQHLPWMALAFAHEQTGGGGNPVWVMEFRHQVLDFLAANPPGWGVNWACAMDVGIRAANIILAWDIFRAHGAQFDQEFEEELAAAMLAHGRHVVHFLEWSPRHRGNHYLANLVGLAFIATYLPASEESDLWLVFAAQQLDGEIIRQFAEDGGNFESSTCYHRLSAELAVHGAAVILGVTPQRRTVFAQYDATRWRLKPGLMAAPMAWPPFSPQVASRLADAARLVADVSLPNGDMLQIGDNDSGRLFKLTPVVDGDWRSRDLDGTHLPRALSGLLNGGDGGGLDGWMVAALAGGQTISVSGPAPVVRPVARDPEPTPTAQWLTRLIIRPADPACLSGLRAVAYPQFGLYLWRNETSLISLRCGALADGLGAHAHNDQLAMDIHLGGQSFARDPGSFVYTADLSARNRYRSALAHFVPRLGKAEPARLDMGPFRLDDSAQGRVIHFDTGSALACHVGFGVPLYRRVRFDADTVVIEDSCGGVAIGPQTEIQDHHITDPADLTRLWGLDIAFSPGYGRLHP